jgi:hypothetical protein
VLLKALAERLQGRDWVLKGGTNLRLYFGSIRFSEDIDLDVGKGVAGAVQRAIPATLADGDVQRRLQALGILQASLIGGRSSKSTDTTLRYKIELVGRGGSRPPTKIDVSYRDRCEGDEHAVRPANDSAVREYIFAQMTRRFYCRATRGLQPSVRSSMPLPRARTCRPAMYSICFSAARVA